MGRELEVYKCPNCGAENRVGWTGKQTERLLPCITCAQDIYEFKNIELTDSEGGKYQEATCTGKIIDRKGYFTVKRDLGDHFKIEGEIELDVKTGAAIFPRYTKTDGKLERINVDG